MSIGGLPRGCGVTVQGTEAIYALKGLSPRMRGCRRGGGLPIPYGGGFPGRTGVTGPYIRRPPPPRADPPVAWAAPGNQRTPPPPPSPAVTSCGSRTPRSTTTRWCVSRPVSARRR